uniref:Small ribosomal subunit protein uS3c n=1 Tax=Schizocladia ischiensis TaxID=196139 RepID=A0A7S6U9Z8_9STRA|nr:ribosomal protein S3 [Schizocladia ischiensis]QOW07540.1 ribosomal protein S3 [Schizocladia ischiensis]
MGHKTHPLGFRLGIIESDKSVWYSKSISYADFIKQDYKIRQTAIQFFKSKNISQPAISKILIKRNHKEERVFVDIHTALPAEIVGEFGSNLYGLDNCLTSLLRTEKVLLNVIEVKDPYLEATLLADILVQQLEERVPFRRAIKSIIERAQQGNPLGVKVQIGGRLNGAEIARVEWLQKGRVPLQTLRANIDYSNKTARTTYGILGVKIWLFKDEILTK